MKSPKFALLALVLSSGTAIGQETKLEANGGAPCSLFGHSVALAQGTALVGASAASTLGANSGSAYLFDAEPTSSSYGSQLAQLDATDGVAQDRFGGSVALGRGPDGATGPGPLVALVGAASKSDMAQWSGAAYLFDAQVGSPTYAQELTRVSPLDGGYYHLFGFSAAMDRGWGAVGAPQADGVSLNAGAVYIFNTDPNSPLFGGQLTKLVATDGATWDGFGSSVSLDGGLALVGARNDGVNTGSVYLFDVDPASSSFGLQLAKWLASDGNTDDLFGYSVALRAGLALVGAPHDSPVGLYSGSAYAFDADPASPGFGSQLHKFWASDGAMEREFGSAVALDGGLALIGSRGDWLGGLTGSAYFFDALPASTSFGQEISVLSASDGGADDQFGVSVALDGGLPLVGAMGCVNSTLTNGAAYLYTTSYTCDLVNVCIAAPNSAASGGSHLATGGSASVSANDLALYAMDLPPQQFGIFFYAGMAQVPTPFGNGFLCLYGSMYRFAPVPTGSVGLGVWFLDINNPPSLSGQITPLSTWWFQFWYRDPLAGGAYYNLSDALRIRFCY
ncbi:MAG: hypothetical protein QF724_07580 [Planctomycetota bacterium]|jgi:hypothetical protein|nr:hypothetical protein [Planctomycetota bacterium]MDP6519789.1 hypothetical protein [Planctomycetota bacterium]MDP6838780.1 hypothetical protein [Planctomycetota bacterium]